MYCCYQDLLIRDWHPRDRQATADLISQVLAEYGLYWEPETADRDILTVEASYWAQGGEFWVVEQAGTLVGTAAYYPVAPEQFGVAQIPDQAQPLDGPAVEMRKLYLLPVVRGRGLGTWLVQQLERSIADRGYSMIWIETATVLREATKLYEKQGYCHQDMSQLVVERCDLLMAKAIQSEPIQERPLGKVAAFATTRAGVEVLSRICGDFRIPLWSAAPVWAELAQFTSAPDRGDRFSSPPAIAPGTPGNLTASVLPPHLCHSYESSLRETLTRIWQDYDGFIFSLATGAIILLI
ncbi:MAG: GNAT family N-acetyltransferase [Prochlorothrix sp.]